MRFMKKAIQHTWNYFVLLILTALSVHANAAGGSTSGSNAGGSQSGGSMPWDTPLASIKGSLLSTVAPAVATIAFVVAGAVLVFGGELNQFGQRVVYIVMACAVLIGAPALLGLF